jgi:hypothetical protein
MLLQKNLDLARGIFHIEFFSLKGIVFRGDARLALITKNTSETRR